MGVWSVGCALTSYFPWVGARSLLFAFASEAGLFVQFLSLFPAQMSTQQTWCADRRRGLGCAQIHRKGNTGSTWKAILVSYRTVSPGGARSGALHCLAEMGYPAPHRGVCTPHILPYTFCLQPPVYASCPYATLHTCFPETPIPPASTPMLPPNRVFANRLVTSGLRGSRGVPRHQEMGEAGGDPTVLAGWGTFGPGTGSFLNPADLKCSSQ